MKTLPLELRIAIYQHLPLRQLWDLQKSTAVVLNDIEEAGGAFLRRYLACHQTTYPENRSFFLKRMAAVDKAMLWDYFECLATRHRTMFCYQCLKRGKMAFCCLGKWCLRLCSSCRQSDAFQQIKCHEAMVEYVLDHEQVTSLVRTSRQSTVLRADALELALKVHGSIESISEARVRHHEEEARRKQIQEQQVLLYEQEYQSRMDQVAQLFPDSVKHGAHLDWYLEDAINSFVSQISGTLADIQSRHGALIRIFDVIEKKGLDLDYLTVYEEFEAWLRYGDLADDSILHVCLEDLRAESRAIEERHETLVDALASHGLAIRSDSVLCHRFVETGCPRLETVVTVMVEMDWLHQHTEYSTRVSAALDALFSWQLDDDVPSFNSESDYREHLRDDCVSVEDIKEETKVQCVKDYLLLGGDRASVPLSLLRRV